MQANNVKMLTAADRSARSVFGNLKFAKIFIYSWKYIL